MLAKGYGQGISLVPSPEIRCEAISLLEVHLVY